MEKHDILTTTRNSFIKTVQMYAQKAHTLCIDFKQKSDNSADDVFSCDMYKQWNAVKVFCDCLSSTLIAISMEEDTNE